MSESRLAVVSSSSCTCTGLGILILEATTFGREAGFERHWWQACASLLGRLGNHSANGPRGSKVSTGQGNIRKSCSSIQTRERVSAVLGERQDFTGLRVVTGIYPPTVPAFDLWLALFCAVTECCTSFLIFTPAITETFSQNFLILGLVITIITSQLTVSSAFEWTMKTVIASWYGAAFGCAIVAFVTAVNHNHYDPYIGVAVSIPFAIFVCLAEQANVTHCKLSAVYRGDKALLLIMIVVVFGGDAPYWAALTACIAYTTGTTITLLGTLILWCLHLLPRPGPPPMAWLGLCMSEYFEEISSVAPCWRDPAGRARSEVEEARQSCCGRG
ncbi:Aluminum-activated malate transporter 1 [Perkinsus olseni]|uniref:Aluminum-activated malate transporter 1 n=1 Tax=Perkinsus olseni TaxID=32597 RepID=A0A7J6PFZ2_PEROL|nr:Aluminum-activated malate transporter 1 [Perkinsus olseni]